MKIVKITHLVRGICFIVIAAVVGIALASACCAGADIAVENQSSAESTKPVENRIRISGRVIDGTTDTPLKNVKLKYPNSPKTDGNSISTLTDANGIFLTEGLENGAYVIETSFDEYVFSRNTVHVNDSLPAEGIVKA